MTRTHLHGVTILADATMAMVTFPQGRPRRFFIRTAEGLALAQDVARSRSGFGMTGHLNARDVVDALRDAWESHIEEAWAALEARTKPEGGE